MCTSRWQRHLRFVFQRLRSKMRATVPLQQYRALGPPRKLNCAIPNTMLSSPALRSAIFILEWQSLNAKAERSPALRSLDKTKVHTAQRACLSISNPMCSSPLRSYGHVSPSPCRTVGYSVLRHIKARLWWYRSAYFSRPAQSCDCRLPTVDLRGMPTMVCIARPPFFFQAAPTSAAALWIRCRCRRPRRRSRRIGEVEHCVSSR